MKKRLAVIILTLLPIALFATVWATIPVDHMIHYADLVVVCKVIRCPWERDGSHRSPCLIEIKLTKVLIGNEKDSDLLVNWGDHTLGYKNIKEGKEYIVFLRRWDAGFLDFLDKGDRRIKYMGTEINNNYDRFNSEYWIREIINGEIAWINNRNISIDEFAKVIQNQRNRPLAQPNICKRYYKRFLRYLCGSPHSVPATILVIVGGIFICLRSKINAGLNALSARIWHSERANIVQTGSSRIAVAPSIWLALGTAWILTGVILFFV